MTIEDGQYSVAFAMLSACCANAPTPQVVAGFTELYNSLRLDGATERDTCTKLAMALIDGNVFGSWLHRKPNFNYGGVDPQPIEVIAFAPELMSYGPTIWPLDTESITKLHEQMPKLPPDTPATTGDLNELKRIDDYEVGTETPTLRVLSAETFVVRDAPAEMTAERVMSVPRTFFAGEQEADAAYKKFKDELPVELCEDCPPIGHPDTTRCAGCPRYTVAVVAVS